MLTRELLERVFPPPTSAEKRQIWTGYVDAIIELEPELARAGVLTPRILPHLLATWGAETGGLTLIQENMSYTSVAGIMRIFGQGVHSAGVTEREARTLVRNPYMLAERVYGLGNPHKARELGNTQAGDGYRFRGAGIQQITGRRDHERYATAIHVPIEALTDPVNSVRVALLEWTNKGCNAPAERDDEVAVRKLINGGRNGLPMVREYIAVAKRALREASAGPEIVRDGFGLGERGTHVGDLQRRLVARGYAVGTIDDRFGPRTEGALLAFQKAYGLPVTGRADTATLAAFAEVAPVSIVPGREDLDVATLRSRGSATIALWDRIQGLGRWIMGGGIGNAVDQYLGLGLVEGAIAQAERVRGVAGRVLEALGMSVPLRWIGLAAIIGAGVWLYRTAAEGQEVRLDDAKSGANMGR